MNYDSWQRILVVGSIGCGKTRLSIAIGEILDIPVIHLDREFYLPGFVKPPATEWLQKIANIAAMEQWVMDGNYFDTMQDRLERADAIIFVNLPCLLCIYRALRRTAANIGITRPDIGLPERFHLPHLFNIVTYKFRKTSRINASLAAARRREIDVVELRSDQQIEQFLCCLRMA